MCHMCHTQTLRLGNNQISDTGVTALAQACAGGAMAQLKGLYLTSNQIGEAGKDTMKNAMSKSDCQVLF